MIQNSLTLYDLIESLTQLRDELIEQGGDDDIQVVSSSDYGDHTHTEQLVLIQSIEVVNPVKSGYSSSGYAFPGDLDDGEENNGNGDKVIVLRHV